MKTFQVSNICVVITVIEFPRLLKTMLTFILDISSLMTSLKNPNEVLISVNYFFLNVLNTHGETTFFSWFDVFGLSFRTLELESKVAW